MEEGGRSLFVPLPIHIIQQLKAAVTHKTMIRLNSLDCKMKNIMSALKGDFELVLSNCVYIHCQPIFQSFP